ncbi:MAG: hypothetical protein ONB44_13010 [candidate division KSB1 bacterium]|nr:hypothetical protein [candidate division KSB1 bacterium]MDZ7303040.1 hypothetical protein [candidate division KSB1 bacterium]MDZ7312452.1 hypothetical protein [candidate division KSB1 bacterium]
MEALTTDRLPTREEIDAYGEAADKIYEKLRPQLEAEHWGKYITINPVNGDYAISRTLEAADNKLRKKYPSIAFVTYRIGYKAVAHFGGTGASDGRRPKGGRHDQGQN